MSSCKNCINKTNEIYKLKQIIFEIVNLLRDLYQQENDSDSDSEYQPSDYESE